MSFLLRKLITDMNIKKEEMFPYKNNLLKKSVNFTFFEISSKFDVRFYWLHFHFKNLKMSSCWDARLCEISICNCESNTAMQLCYFPVYHANETFPICFHCEKIFIYIYRVTDILIRKPQPFNYKGFLFSMYIWPMSNINFSL